ncbi:MAG TPA: aldose epimerase family protein [Cyclobacteriaceae bacterium]|nr:aldose epimerase family protein [Cyclobacteriaceae bacterium]
MERIKKETFGAGRNGEQVHAYTILNASGARIRVLTYGAILSEVWVPDRNNRLADVVLGYHSIDKYITKNAQFGTIVGRYGNRIANGRFSLDGVEYKLATNNGPNHLHGGPMGFDKKTWEAEEVAGENYAGVKLHYHSADGEEGYPGNLDVYVTYTLNDSNEIRIEYSAIADKPTVLNLTNHSYFNLKGQGEGNILDHELILFAEKYIPTDSTSIPLGPLADVEGTPFDFREAHQIGERIGAENNEQLKFGKGYDHSFVVNGNTGTLRPAARLRDSSTGRVLDVLTTEPAVQLYTGNNLNESYIGKDGHVYNKNSGVCLETQHYPDSPNRPEYPLTVLRPGQTYTQTTIFKFSVD